MSTALRLGVGVATVAAGSLVVLPLLTRAEASSAAAAPGEGGDRTWTCLYLGRVWHRRFVPAVHAFWYSIFFSYLDLQEVEEGVLDRLWPLCASRGRAALASFDEKDHLKGYMEGQGLSLAERVRRLVEEKTGCRPEGRICLLTHLRVLGYCFNPVSFYYCWDKAGQRVETVVAEVSNTPWNEMHPYVLDARNTDVQVRERPPSSSSSKEGEEGEGVVTNYRFDKAFHVSPFMDMQHVYDWDFSTPGRQLWVCTGMIKGQTRYFTAKFVVSRRPLSLPYVAYCLLRYPAITWAVQLFIHLQAFKLWVKRVPFYPHPQGAETWASRAVATAMAPLWALQDAIDRRRRRSKEKAQQQEEVEVAGEEGARAAPAGEVQQAALAAGKPGQAEGRAEEEEERSRQEDRPTIAAQ